MASTCVLQTWTPEVDTFITEVSQDTCDFPFLGTYPWSLCNYTVPITHLSVCVWSEGRSVDISFRAAPDEYRNMAVLRARGNSDDLSLVIIRPALSSVDIAILETSIPSSPAPRLISRAVRRTDPRQQEEHAC